MIYSISYNLRSNSVQATVSSEILPRDKSGVSRVRCVVPNLRVEAKNWKNGRLKTATTGYKEVNKRLIEIEESLNDYLKFCYASGKTASPEAVRDIIRGIKTGGDFFDLFKRYIKESEKTKSPATVSNNKKTLKSISVFAKDTAFNMSLENMTNNFFTAWRDWQIVNGHADTSSKLRLSILKAFLRWVTGNEYEVPQYYQIWKIDAKAKRPIDLTESDIKAMLSIEKPHLRAPLDLMFFQYMTGMRFKDTQETEIFITGDQLRFTPHKTERKTGRIVNQTISPELKSAILTNKMRYGRHCPSMSHTLYNRWLKQIAKLAGLTDMVSRVYTSGTIKREEKPLCDWIGSHDLRHAAANHLVQSGATMEDVAAFLGDTLRQVSETYYHHNAEQNLQNKANRIAKIDNRLRKAE